MRVVVIVAALVLGVVAWRVTSRRVARIPEAGAEHLEVPTRTDLAEGQTMSEREHSDSWEPGLAQATLREAIATEKAIDKVRITGKVVLPNGTPVDESVFVIATSQPAKSGQPVRAQVEPDGSFEFFLSAEPLAWYFDLDARYLALKRPVRAAVSFDRELVLEPYLGGALEVKLVAPQGEGKAEELQEASVELQRSTRYGTRESFGAVSVKGGIGEDLVARFGGLAPTQRYQLSVIPQTLARAVLDNLSVRPGQITRGTLRFSEGGILRGFVEDENGERLDGAEVRVAVDKDDSGLPWSAATDESGAFEIRALVPGRVSGTVWHEDLSQDYYPLLEIGAGRVVEDFVIVLEQRGIVSGRVLWPDGSPASNASIQLTPMDVLHLGQLSHRTEADERGIFRIAGIDSKKFDSISKTNTYLLQATASRDLDGDGPRQDWIARLADVPVGAHDLEIRLRRGLSLEGKVVDHVGVPFDRFRIEVTPVETIDAYSVVAREVFGKSVTFADPNGSFVVDGLYPGDWLVTAQHIAPHAPTGLAVRKRLPGDGAEIVLVLGRLAEVSGRVIDSLGKPVVGAFVRVAGCADCPEDRTGKNGKYQLKDLAAGRFNVLARAPGVGISYETELVLKPGEKREGVELKIEVPGELEIYGSSGPISGEPKLFRVSSLDAVRSFAETAEADREGRVTIDLPPGEYSVATLSAEVRDVAGATLRATVRAGQKTRVIFEEAASRRIDLYGTVSSAGIPVGEGYISISEDKVTIASAELNPLGNYEVSIPGPGIYEVKVGSWSSEVVVHDVDSLRLDLDLPVQCVRGQVSGPGGHPLGWVTLCLVPTIGSSAVLPWVLSERDGTFVFEYVSPGTYFLLADPNSGAMRWGATRSEGLGLIVTGPYEVGANPMGTELQIQLGPGGGAVALVQDGLGAPIRGALVELLLSEERAVSLPFDQGGRTDRTGALILPLFGERTVGLRARLDDRVTKTERVRIIPGELVDVTFTFPE